MPATPDTRIQFRASPPLRDFLNLRGHLAGRSADLQAKQDLETWSAVLYAELDRIQFTIAELTCIADILASVAAPATPARMNITALEFNAEIRDNPAIKERYSYELLRKLAIRLDGLGPAADIAVLDALARWREGDMPATSDAFSAAGFRCLP